MTIEPNTPEERFVRKGSITLRKYVDWADCKKDDYMVYTVCKNIRFNDVYASFIHCEGYTPSAPKVNEVSKYIEVPEGWIMTVITREEVQEEVIPEPTLEDKQITFF